MKLQRGSSKSLTLRLIGGDLSGCTGYFTITQARGGCPCGDVQLYRVISFEYDEDTNTSTATVQFSQEETLQLSEGEATAQVRYVSATGNADGTVRQIIQITGIDLEGVIAHAD